MKYTDYDGQTRWTDEDEMTPEQIAAEVAANREQWDDLEPPEKCRKATQHQIDYDPSAWECVECHGMFVGDAADFAYGYRPLCGKCGRP